MTTKRMLVQNVPTKERVTEKPVSASASMDILVMRVSAPSALTIALDAELALLSTNSPLREAEHTHTLGTKQCTKVVCATLDLVALTAPFVNVLPTSMSWVERVPTKDVTAPDVACATMQPGFALASAVTTEPAASPKPSFSKCTRFFQRLPF